MYSKKKTIVLTLPEVNVGSVIDKQYTILNQKPQIGRHFFDSFYLIFNVPVKEFVYREILPESLPVKVHLFNNAMKPEETRKDGEVTYLWKMSELNEVRSEECSPPDNTLYPWVVITSIDDWKIISDLYRGLVEKNVTADDEAPKKT